VSSTGKISSRGPGTTGAQRQREALEAEGVIVHDSRDGGFGVKWTECGWFPEAVDLGPEGEREVDVDDRRTALAGAEAVTMNDGEEEEDITSESLDHL
jgi:hypothetical protein